MARRLLSPGIALIPVLVATTLFGGGAVLAASKSSNIPTKNYIDTISGYTDLSTCAELVLSTVVRGEYSGCADTYALTSFTCFCTDSSSYMSEVISSDVEAACPASVASAQASSALGVFAAYCELGVPAGLTPQTAQVEAGSSATPAGTASPATATVTLFSTPSGSSSPDSGALSSTSTAIIVGALVTSFGIAVIIAAWVFWRKHHRAMKTLQAWPDASRGPDTSGASGYSKGDALEVPVYERPGEMLAVGRPTEMLTTETPAEVAAQAHPVELPAGRWGHASR